MLCTQLISPHGPYFSPHFFQGHNALPFVWDGDPEDVFQTQTKSAVELSLKEGHMVFYHVETY